jgi:hypothetical protein
VKPIKGAKSPGQDFDRLLKIMASLTKKEMPKIVQNNTGIKYSKLLLDLIKPYHQDMTDGDELEYLLDMGIIGWNLALYKQKDEQLYESYWSGIKSSGELDKESQELIKKLQQDKEKKFGEHTMLLDSFEISIDKKGIATVNVVSKPLDEEGFQEFASAFFRNNFAEEEASHIEDNEADDMPDFVLPVLDRNAVSIKPKLSFYNWLRKIHFPEEPPAKLEENSIYLLQEQETNEDVTKYLKKNFDRIFCSELWAWDMDENNWPKNRTYKMFTEWFEVTTHCMLYDLEKDPVNKE